jgi:flagellar basal-body rod protein FlgC
MDVVRSIQVAATGLKAQAGRMRVIAENLANANSTAQTPGGEPYRRRVPTFRATLDRELGATTVAMGQVQTDNSAFQRRHEPGHPAADENGYVQFPNVNTLVETTDMREAQRSYEANLNVIGTTRRIVQRTLDILRG